VKTANKVSDLGIFSAVTIWTIITDVVCILLASTFASLTLCLLAEGVPCILYFIS